MPKGRLVERIVGVLRNENYNTYDYKGCFDIAAKLDNTLFIKVLQNVDSISSEQVKNLKVLAKNMGATALLVGRQTRREKLKEGVVYERFGLPVVSPRTFELLVEEGIFPSIYRDKGGMYVDIDRPLLRETRRRKGLTQRELAEAVGISKKAIYEHESRNLRMMLNIARRLEGILKKDFVKDIDILNRSYHERGAPADRLEQRIGMDFHRLGFATDYVKQAPLDIFAKERVLLISDVETDKRRLGKRIGHLREFVCLTKKPALVITERLVKGRIEGIPIIERSELEEMDTKELIRIARSSK